MTEKQKPDAATQKKPKKPRAPKRKTKGESLGEIEAILASIEAKSAEVKVARIAWEDSKEIAKIKKGVWQTKLDEMEELADTRLRWAEEAKRQPLFGAAQDSAIEKRAAEAAAMAREQANGDSSTTETTDWRRTRVDKSGLFTDAQANALEMAGLRTLGGLQEALIVNPEWWAKNAKVNGRFKEPIEQALTKFVTEKSA